MHCGSQARVLAVHLGGRSASSCRLQSVPPVCPALTSAHLSRACVHHSALDLRARSLTRNVHDSCRQTARKLDRKDAISVTCSGNVALKREQEEAGTSGTPSASIEGFLQSSNKEVSCAEDEKLTACPSITSSYSDPTPNDGGRIQTGRRALEHAWTFVNKTKSEEESAKLKKQLQQRTQECFRLRSHGVKSQLSQAKRRTSRCDSRLSEPARDTGQPSQPSEDGGFTNSTDMSMLPIPPTENDEATCDDAELPSFGMFYSINQPLVVDDHLGVVVASGKAEVDAGLERGPSGQHLLCETGPQQTIAMSPSLMHRSVRRGEAGLWPCSARQVSKVSWQQPGARLLRGGPPEVLPQGVPFSSRSLRSLPAQRTWQVEQPGTQAKPQTILQLLPMLTSVAGHGQRNLGSPVS